MKYGYLFLLLVIFCCIAPVYAAEIKLTADQKEYYIPLGQNAEIPLSVSSTYDHAIGGTIQFTITEQLQNTGTVMTSTQNRVYPHSVPPGDSQMTLSGGASDKEKTVKVQVAFDYTDTTPMEVSLPEILIHFVAQPPSSSASQSPVTSTSGPSSGNVPSSSSVQIVQQTVSVQQQAGRDGSLQQAVSENQMPQDANALKQQLQREAQEKEQDKQQFEETLARDPLMQSVNESLAADGFTRQSQATSPASGNAGTFTSEYRNPAGDRVTVAGEMQNGAVPSIAESSAAPVNVTAPLATNATFRQIAQQLHEKGFSRNQTFLNVSATGSTINLTYQNPEGKKAFVNATTLDGNLTQVALETEPEAEVNYLPLLAAILTGAVLLIGAWALYRRYRRRPAPPGRAISDPLPEQEPLDHRKAALDLLEKAELAFREARYREAYGMAGQALRLFHIHEYGACHEMTNTELIAYLQAQNKDTVKIRTMLDTCSDVEFAKGAGNDNEFFAMLVAIRSQITGP